MLFRSNILLFGRRFCDSISMINNTSTTSQFKNNLTRRYSFMGYDKFDELHNHLAINDKNSLMYTDALNNKYVLSFDENNNLYFLKLVEKTL